jgi:hypothetical protein
MRRILFCILKNYKVLLIFIVVLFLFIGFINGTEVPRNVNSVDNFKETMGSKYNEAIAYLLSNTWITDTLMANNIDPGLAMAIVFPEVVRFSWLRDKMEIAGLFSLYVQYGEKYANFSVGRFQMKPDFACQLERDARKIGLFISPVKSEFGKNATIESRLERVKRLDNPLWQVRYLITYIKVLDNLYKSNKWKSLDEKIRFYATAYNYGYCKAKLLIQKQTFIKSFYTTIVPGEDRYCYADISLDFFYCLKQIQPQY